jgi:sodium-dependent dicarboxylate transporter 2/3/5
VRGGHTVASTTAPQPGAGADLDRLLDLSRTKLSVVTTRKGTKSERWMRYLGFPVGVAVFLALYLMPTPVGLTSSAQGAIASFALALIWWVTEPFPTYVTSLCLMALLVFLNAWDSEHVLGVLGLDVIWLNVMAFVLSSILIKTNLAKRLALALIVRFGHSAWSMLLAFTLLQLALAPLIPATAARAVMTLPIMLVVAAIYGASAESPSNFGRSLFLQNMFGINVFSSGFMTGSTANLIAIAFISGMAGRKIYYTDWLVANLPVVVIAGFFSWVIVPRLLFPLAAEERAPRLAGGVEKLRQELARMGPLSREEKRGAAIFALVVALWVTDRFHAGWFGFEISPVFAAMIGVIITFVPRIGILTWNEADIPWHLMLFSAGAYAGGLALDDTGAARWVIANIFESLHFSKDVSFWWVYGVVIAVNMFSHFFFTSKTVRTIIMIPFVIAIAQQLGYDPVWLALPAAFTLDWVIGLPISGKPNVILFSTGQYSVLDNLKYGLVMTAVGTLLLVLAGMTWFRVLGVTPRF